MTSEGAVNSDTRRTIAGGEGVLVCAATAGELDAWGEGAEERLVLGVGVPLTLLALLSRLADPRFAKPSLLFNIGIAGAYPGTGIGIGDIVIGGSEVYADIGFELPEPPGFRPIAEAPFGARYQGAWPLVLPEGKSLITPPPAPPLGREGSPTPQGGGSTSPPSPLSATERGNRIPDYPSPQPPPLGREGEFRVHVGGRGATVSTCTGTEATGALRARLFEADFETMEGAAVAQAGGAFGIPVCEIRAISNIAARRDMRPENIRLALANLAQYLCALRRSVPTDR